MKKLNLFLTALVAAGAGGCKSSGLKKITVAEVTHSLFYAPQYVAASKGYFEEEGLKVSFVNAGGADVVMAMLLSNEAKIGLMGSEASIYVKNKGETNHAINFAQLTQRDGSFIVGRGNQPNFQFSDLKGKEILGGRVGGMPEMVLEYILKQKGINVVRDASSVDANTVNINTIVKFNAMAGSFTSGSGDYVSLFEPTASKVASEANFSMVASLGKESGEIPYTAYSTTKKYMGKNGEVIEKFTRAVHKGLLFVLANDAATIAETIKGHFVEMEIADLTKSLQSYIDINAWPTDLIMKESNFNKLQDIIDLAGELTKRASYSELVNTDFASMAKDSVKL